MLALHTANPSLIPGTTSSEHFQEWALITVLEVLLSTTRCVPTHPQKNDSHYILNNRFFLLYLFVISNYKKLIAIILCHFGLGSYPHVHGAWRTKSCQESHLHSHMWSTLQPFELPCLLQREQMNFLILKNLLLLSSGNFHVLGRNAKKIQSTVYCPPERGRSSIFHINWAKPRQTGRGGPTQKTKALGKQNSGFYLKSVFRLER